MTTADDVLEINRLITAVVVFYNEIRPDRSTT